ncbi:MAG: 5-bromo-4-chloroindolyl phosphate hydrolysis family protein, partial [Vallitaleaceae bacterium]|nr:5-bromo-4-chloroindolyl phosphate hydrolysis family protein [Vallitaleaceae bacterium]
IISKIIEYVEVHPEKLSEVRRFMEYYLPTTLKLLNAYREFDRQPIQGENIRTAKSEIKNALDTINGAFENLLDSLFENAAWDVSTDISVLQTILAQEGLTDKDFNTNKTEGGKNE